MSDKDWTDLGNDIRDMVDDAVKSQDFRKLNENICRTVTDGLDNISKSIKKNLGYGDPHGPYQNNNGQWGPHYTNGPGVPPGQPQGPNPAGLFLITAPETGVRGMVPIRAREILFRGIPDRQEPGDRRMVFLMEIIRRDNGSITVRPRMPRARRYRMLFHRQGTA